MNVSPFNSGVQGVLRANELASDAASRIAQSGTTATPNPADDTVKAVADLKQAEVQAAASARVIEADERNVGRLLDVRA